MPLELATCWRLKKKGSVSIINGNTFEERNGKFYFNGREIKDGYRVEKGYEIPAFLFGFSLGIVFVIGIAELGALL